MHAIRGGVYMPWLEGTTCAQDSVRARAFSVAAAAHTSLFPPTRGRSVNNKVLCKE